MFDNKVEYIIKNGHVIDPSANIDKIADVAISHGKVVGIDLDCEAKKYINAEGCYVFPGIIDFHVHAGYGYSAISEKPDWMLGTGVTAVVDAGSTGYANFGAFLNVVNNSTVKVKCQLSPYSGGQIDERNIEDYSTGKMFPERIIDVCEKYKDLIIGLKLRVSRNVVGDAKLACIEDTIKIAERLPGRHICVHTTDPPETMTYLADMLRPGDIITHCYHGRGNTIVDENGKVFDGIKAARERGIIFDVGHGHMNYGTKTAVAALADGFYPDVISTDMTLDKVGLSHIVRSMPQVMSKFMAMGMPLVDVVRAVTETPAELMGMKDEIGTLKSGAIADVCIMKKIDLERDYPDLIGDKISGSEALIPQLTMADGQVVYANETFMGWM